MMRESKEDPLFTLWNPKQRFIRVTGNLNLSLIIEGTPCKGASYNPASSSLAKAKSNLVI